jgi:hypothetical protein
MLKNEHHMLFFMQNIVIACEKKFSILFTSLIIKRVNTSLVHMDLFHIRIFLNSLEVFL